MKVQGKIFKSCVGYFYVRSLFHGSISITAQCIESQLMPNESSRKDLQIMCGLLLRQISLSWCNLLDKVSTSAKLFLLKFFFFFLSRGHFWANCVQVFQRNCRLDLNETSHVCSWVVCGLQCKILLTSRMTFTFQGHNYVKSHFGPYLSSCWTNRHQILTLGSFGWGLSINQKTS